MEVLGNITSVFSPVLAVILRRSRGEEGQDSGSPAFQCQPASLPGAVGRSAITFITEMFFLLIRVGCNNEEAHAEILIIWPLVEGEGCQV